MNVDNSPVDRESNDGKANTKGELSTLKKRKLDQLKQPNNADYDSDDLPKTASTAIFPPRLASRSPIINAHSQLPHEEINCNSGDDEQDNDDDHIEERAVSTTQSPSSSLPWPTSLRDIELPQENVGSGGL
ncbi:hypothetical protein K432DRAFT_402342 [Lepidopterella palustris CBS 459.81]|uniref:Uncharacterized protein n=1 Tax=Lepidopterella palustris CBS 459.81 TaxID=1314670 RepID=A0A8E2JIC8_9PEZI|nr:hypothetical protein K432DRAFT_402342 [Lepidopterella palustris CBS 459.81]